MSKIDYQALREAAEKATWGDWDSYKPHRGARGYEVRLSSQAIAQHVLKNNAEFIAAFNPKIALALLDERERNQQYIKLRDQENEDIALTVGELRVELEGKDKLIAELRKQCAEWERKAYSNFEECAAMADRIEYMSKQSCEARERDLFESWVREGSADNAIEQRCNHSPCRQQGKSVVSKKRSALGRTINVNERSP